MSTKALLAASAVALFGCQHAGTGGGAGGSAAGGRTGSGTGSGGASIAGTGNGGSGGGQPSTGGAGGGLPGTGGVRSGGTTGNGGSATSGGAASGGGPGSGGAGMGGAASGGGLGPGGTGGFATGGVGVPGGAGGLGAGGTGVRGGVGGTAVGGGAGGASGGVGGRGTGGAGLAGSGGAAGTGGTQSAAPDGGSDTCGSGGSGAYYLDSVSGDDSADGRSPATAWKSLSKINAVTLQPGNWLCLKAGSSFTGQLAPKGSGTGAAPIVLDQYGSGAKPIVAAGTSDADAVYLLNQQYWEINNLEVTNKKSSLGDYRGIHIVGQNGGTLSHFVIRNCFVHDVTGEVDWIGGSTADNAPGVTFQTGWDQSKRTGGIVFEVQAGTGSATKTRFSDVLIENNKVQDCSFGGIIFKQLDGDVHWGTRSSASDSTWTPHTNVTLRGNYISQLNTDYGCNAVYLTDVQNALVENNVVNGAGTSAIELYYTDAVTVQHNETFGTKVKAGGADSNGMDTDKATTKTIIQYNYFHDNGDGILLCQFSFGDSVVRYNILQNNSRYQIYLHSDPAASSVVYNNTVYNDKSNSGVAYGYGTSLDATYVLTNNIFVATAGKGVLTTGGSISYQNNIYFGSAIVVPSGDAKALTADPKLVAPGSGGNGSTSGPAFASLDGYKLQSGSPAINAGMTIANNGGVDFWGGTLVGTPDIGAYESR